MGFKRWHSYFIHTKTARFTFSNDNIEREIKKCDRNEKGLFDLSYRLLSKVLRISPFVFVFEYLCLFHKITETEKVSFLCCVVFCVSVCRLSMVDLVGSVIAIGMDGCSRCAHRLGKRRALRVSSDLLMLILMLRCAALTRSFIPVQSHKMTADIYSPNDRQ